MTRLIFCLGANRKYPEFARRLGYDLGARLPGSVYVDRLRFADQDWRPHTTLWHVRDWFLRYRLRRLADMLVSARAVAHASRRAYMAALARHRPETASVLDWERWGQRAEVLDWAEEAAQYVSEAVVIIPKVSGGPATLPREIGGRRVILGYSVPTTHGATRIGLREFDGWPLHILGGSPRQQMQVAQMHRGEVVQADGNMVHKAAGMGTYWRAGRWHKSGRHATPTSWALMISLINVAWEWERLWKP